MTSDRLIELEAGWFLLELYGSRIEFCSSLEMPRDFGLMNFLTKIDGRMIPVDVDYSPTPFGKEQFQDLLERRDFNRNWSSDFGADGIILCVVRDGNVNFNVRPIECSADGLSISSDVFEEAAAHGVVIRQLVYQEMGESSGREGGFLRDTEDDRLDSDWIIDHSHSMRPEQWSLPLEKMISRTFPFASGGAKA